MKQFSIIKNVVDWLKSEHNYIEYEESYGYPYNFKTRLQKKVESEFVCESNERLSVNIWVSEIQMTDNIHESYRIEIVAEKNAKRWNISCYSMDRAGIISNVEEVESDLIRLFNQL